MQRLDSASENESDCGSQDSRVKKARIRSTNKSFSKLKKTVPAPPPVPFVASRKCVVSPHELVRLNTSQLEKQSPKKINVYKHSRNSNKNQVTERIFNMRKKIQKEKDENTVLSEKLRQLLSTKKLQKSWKDKASLHQNEEALKHQNVDDYSLLNETQISGMDQNFEDKLDKNVIESTTSDKSIVSEHCTSTNSKVLSSSSEKDFVCNSPNELKRSNPSPSLLSSAVDRNSPFNVRSNDNCLFHSEKSGSNSSQSKEAGKKVN